MGALGGPQFRLGLAHRRFRPGQAELPGLDLGPFGLHGPDLGRGGLLGPRGLESGLRRRGCTLCRRVRRLGSAQGLRGGIPDPRLFRRHLRQRPLGGLQPLPDAGRQRVAVALQVEEAPQHPAALDAAQAEELGEMALGQHDGAGEVLQRQADGLPHQAGHVPLLFGQDIRRAVGADLGEAAPGRAQGVGTLARVAALRPVAAGAAGPLQQEGEVHLDAVLGLVADALEAGGALHPAKERQGDGVQHGGLAAAGGPEDTEDPVAQDLPEIQDLLLAEAVQPAEAQLQRDHADAPSSSSGPSAINSANSLATAGATSPPVVRR